MQPQIKARFKAGISTSHCAVHVCERHSEKGTHPGSYGTTMGLTTATPLSRWLSSGRLPGRRRTSRRVKWAGSRILGRL